MHKTRFLIFGFLAALLPSLTAAGDDGGNRPNVLMIAIDDQND